jgi:hypothetical protein
MRPARVRISGRAQGCLRTGRTEGQAHGNAQSAPAIRPIRPAEPIGRIKPISAISPIKPSPPEYQSPGERQQGPVVMMCDRRYCGCVLRGSNLIQLAVAAVAVLAMAGAAATVLQDLLDALLIGLPVLIAGMAAGFVLQVRSSRKQAIRSRAAAVAPVPRPRPAQVAPVPRPAQAIQPPPRLALDVSPLDVSPLDASPLDVSPLDASPLDASPLDASPLDASPTVAAAALVGERDGAPG